MLPTLLVCNMSDGTKLSAVRTIALRMGLKLKTIGADGFGLSVGALAGLEGFTGNVPDTPGTFDEEMLIMSGLPGDQMNLLLDLFKQKNVIIPLKAVVTETNAAWSVSRLYRELSAERAMFMGLKKCLHNTK